MEVDDDDDEEEGVLCPEFVAPINDEDLLEQTDNNRFFITEELAPEDLPSDLVRKRITRHPEA